MIDLKNLNIESIEFGSNRTVESIWFGPIEVWSKNVPLDDYILISPFSGNTSLSEFNIGRYLRNSPTDIHGEDVSWKATNTIVHYSMSNIFQYEDTEFSDAGEELSAQSSSFEQNLTDQPITREVTFVAIDGNTYSTTITQGAYSLRSYTVTPITTLSQYGFVKDETIMRNLDSTKYDGVYVSNNKGKPNSQAVARIDFTGYSEFTVWINSKAEGSSDYTVASQLDPSNYPTNNDGGYTGNGYSTERKSSSGKYSNTASYQQFIDSTATAPVEDRWRKITYATPDQGSHFIYIVYRKDSSTDSFDDQGRFIIEG